MARRNRWLAIGIQRLYRAVGERETVGLFTFINQLSVANVPNHVPDVQLTIACQLSLSSSSGNKVVFLISI
jgi:hypothetical protein